MCLCYVGLRKNAAATAKKIVNAAKRINAAANAKEEMIVIKSALVPAKSVNATMMNIAASFIFSVCGRGTGYSRHC